MSATSSSSSTSSTSSRATPKPKLDLFHDSPCLVAKKCRTSTPSLRPPKPPTKSTNSIRRYRQYSLQQHEQHHPLAHNCSLQQFAYKKPLFSSRRLNNSHSHYYFDDFHNQHDDINEPQQSSTPTSTCIGRPRAPFDHHDGSFSFGLRNNSILEQEQQDESNCRLNMEFEIICKIGRGNFGDVYKVKSKLEKDQHYAIKRTLMPFSSEADRRRKLQEVKNHEMLPPHENCVKYYDSWEEDGYLYIQTELCKSNLNEIIEIDDENKLPENTVWKYLIDLLLAVKHLHDHDLLHLDIKPDNIFISFDNKAKLGDFGLMCNKLDSIEEGDSKYLASEAMKGKITKAADIFSLGITMFEAATGMDLPQRGETYHKLRHNQIDDLYFNGISDDLVKIIKSMMEADFSRRPMVDQLLQLDVVRARRSNTLLL